MDPPEPTKLMLSRAMASSSRHGINLMPGRLNPATGNCAFESVLFNNNDRSCFKEKYLLSVNFYRRIWMTDIEAKILDDSDWNNGYTSAEIKMGFQQIKESNVYERDFFGDMILPGIANGIHKKILVFNTNPNSPHDPISVISPENFGGYADSQIPIVLAYNLVHFESMHPVSSKDIEGTINLMQSYLNGDYIFNHGDINDLIALEPSKAPESNNVPDKNVQQSFDDNSFSFKSDEKLFVVTMDENGVMLCPVCNKKFQRLRPHLKNKRECNSLIDFEAFEKSFNGFDSNLKKAKEREKKAATRKRHSEDEVKRKRNLIDAERKKEERASRSEEGTSYER